MVQVGNGLAAVVGAALVLLYLGFTRRRAARRQRHAARHLERALADPALSTWEKRLLLRFFYACTRGGFLPVAWGKACFAIPRLSLRGREPGEDAVSSRTLDVLWQCLQIPLARRPLTALLLGGSLMLWALSIGVVAALSLGAEPPTVRAVLKALDAHLAKLQD